MGSRIAAHAKASLPAAVKRGASDRRREQLEEQTRCECCGAAVAPLIGAADVDDMKGAAQAEAGEA